MSSEAVRRQILIAVGALNISLDRHPTSSKVEDACAAAKLLRNRLLREHTRITKKIEALRERQIYDEESDPESDGDNYENCDSSSDSLFSRSEFIFIAEMMVAEKLVIPLLLAHGMAHSDSLLPQLLKLLAVILLPVPRYSSQEVLQNDLLQRIKNRCGTDDFFALLVQCVAPVAEKRASGALQRDDVVILEIVLTLVTRLVEGGVTETEHIIGAFCRNHGIELLLVVINQNFSTTQGRSVENALQTNYDSNESLLTSNPSANYTAPDCQQEATEAGDVISLEDDDGTDSVSLSGNSNSSVDIAFEQEFRQQVHELLENDSQLWRWNCLALTAISSVIQCVPPEELASLAMLNQSKACTSEQLLNTLRNGKQFRDLKRENDNWRFVARSRNGAVTSNGILVRGDGGSSSNGQSIGSVSSLLGTRRKDPFEVLKDMDLRKRGRFVKGMFQGSTTLCNLPLPTKILLSQQCNSFLTFGFEPLSAMSWERLREAVTNVERATVEFKEVVSGYKKSNEVLEISSPLDSQMFLGLRSVLEYMSICRCMMRYIRAMVEQMKQDNMSFLTVFQQQWHSASSIVSLDYLECGFSILRSFLDCKDIRKREDVSIVVGYLAEILLVLNLLLQGDVLQDSAVEVAASALASSVLYKEDNIKIIFGLLTEYSSRNMSITKAQQFTLLTYAVFQLIEKCSYNGNLLMHKRPQQRKHIHDVHVDEAVEEESMHDNLDNESMNSEALEGMQDEMMQDMRDMIDDSDAYNILAAAKTGEEKPETTREQQYSTHRSAEGVPADRPGLSAEEPVSGDVLPSLGTGEEWASLQDDDASPRGHPVSEHRPASVASSGHTAFSAVSSEREVAVSSYLRRLATTKNIGLLYSTMRHWRINDADVNLGLTFLMESLVKDECASVFFNVAFLLLMRDVLVHGEKTHAPLYHICDRIVYDFFNPPFAKSQDVRAAERFTEESERCMLRGARSFLGFEVALRCTRSLFSYSATDYNFLEEKGMPHTMDYTVLSLPDFGATGLTGESNNPGDAANDDSHHSDHHPHPNLTDATGELTTEDARETKRSRKKRQRQPRGERVEKRKRSPVSTFRNEALPLIEGDVVSDSAAVDISAFALPNIDETLQIVD